MDVLLLINQELAALETYTPHDLHKKLEELGVVDRACKNEMPEMSRAVMIVLSTGTANLAVFENAHARVKEAV